MVEEPTRNNATLDLFLTNMPNKVQKTETIPGISDHDIVYLEFDLGAKHQRQKPRNIPLYKKANWKSMADEMKELHNTIKEEHQNGANVEKLWNTFKEELHSSIKRHIPTKKTKTKDKLPWITADIKTLLRKRDRAYKKKKKTNNKQDTAHYKNLKHAVQRKTRQAYWQYINGILTTEDGNERNTSKRFWTYIKHKKNDASGVSPLKKNGILETDPIKQANILNEQFKSVFSQPTPVTPEEFENNNYVNNDKKYPESDEVIISEAGVLKLLHQLNVHKAGGPDEIKPKILKELAEEIAPILTIIFQTSINTSEIPEDWRKARITPAFKKGQKYLAENYRPISLTCVCCKIMEHIITSNIMNHAESNNILYPLQHGFRKKRSCETQLIECIDDITKNLEENKQTDLLILDFSKAFDKVSHSLLLHKLQHYGITDKTTRWIKAFLTDRSQVVAVEGEESESGKVESGVPQGSVLGPSLFLFYINDLPEHLKSTVRLFADDTMAYLTVTNTKDCDTLQKDLDQLAEWEGKWRMEFHPNKCSVISISKKKKPIQYNYTLHGHILAHEKSTKYLGCTVTDDLDWGEHINNICNKANRSLGFLQRNLHISSKSIKEKAYLTLVRPQLEYSCTVWDPYKQTHVDKIDKVQRRAARYVTGRYRNRSSVGDMLEQLHWKDLKTRRKEARLNMMYKITNNEVAINPETYLVKPKRQTRYAKPHCYAVQTSRTDSRKWSFFPRTIIEWNDLPTEMAAAKSLDIFKNQVTKQT